MLRLVVLGVDIEIINNEISDKINTDEQNPTILNDEIPRNGSKIKYVLPDTNEWVVAKVINRAGESGGKNKCWVNIQDKDRGFDPHLGPTVHL